MENRPSPIFNSYTKCSISTSYNYKLDVFQINHDALSTVYGKQNDRIKPCGHPGSRNDRKSTGRKIHKDSSETTDLQKPRVQRLDPQNKNLFFIVMNTEKLVALVTHHPLNRRPVPIFLFYTPPAELVKNLLRHPKSSDYKSGLQSGAEFKAELCNL